MKKLSIIIPVYKVEKYIRKCLNSCLRQDVPPAEYEIVAVNDGSPDECGEILNEYKGIYENLKVVTQSNQGLSIARNNGLKCAEGEYVWFVDSDDWIEENCLKGICESLDKKPDILQLSYQKVYEIDHTVVKVYGKFGADVVMSGKDVILSGGLPSAAQFSIYRRDFLLSNDLKFADGRLHEDIEFKPRVTFLAKTVSWHRPVVYNYLLRATGSIMSSFRLKNGVDIFFAIKSISDFRDRYASDSISRTLFNNYIGKYFNSLMKVYYCLNDEDRKELKSLIKGDSCVFNDMIHSSSTKYKIQGRIFKVSFSAGEIILKLLK